MSNSGKIILTSPVQTGRFGRLLGALCEPGDVIGLGGDLGAGKTALTQAIAAGAGVDPAEYVNSPSFALLHEYHGRIPFYHMDFYRLHGADDVVALGLDEYLYRSGIAVVEWYERAESVFPDSTLFVDLDIVDAGRRFARLRSGALSWKQRIEQLTDRLAGTPDKP
ncbi:tRNA (adenosine(37)-N6)-threonylcarbamoyltransferase complex ATPase subunit type 1 TsaE [Desulfofustis glycolicus]|uniref:tRNA threonylcarbamoyladenosine biosynthesis protein TsaE n=1 Tax=Desulfofustis glycolicus DSM 9705 TaxID=1121409 RepID=A0A1M5WY87_9BACT|nr:tRNA (adenosine(37)-N6)-threonylcarbamoyltransferase complex ATPase subunit type 1 TsaE [Desulfofustis glycolicus]MCB2214494.1 tRNA (adenosine(37)-N6)-threonylcarbamoyltransferase complex ATPase subunit type 1 TsaE [Desulfobulbaceae bacterium]SHH91873.1 tRNA threonylcarbamoyladenosine biosynthesis protein TsaE [Desulfofustis glycolicus DSM 9705]